MTESPPSTSTQDAFSSPQQIPPVYWLRQAAPYIHAYRGKTITVLLPGDALLTNARQGLLHDIALLVSMGMRVVIVPGVRPQIDARLAEDGIPERYRHGMRITDAETMRRVSEVTGRLRNELEAELTFGLAGSPMHQSDVRVCSGNYIVARPIGIIEGVDYGYTGTVRRVREREIRRALDDGQIVLISAIGYSHTGDVFNLSCEDVASSVAIALGCEKLVLYTPPDQMLQDRGRLIREISSAAAMTRVELVPQGSEPARRLLSACRALKRGVRRVHLLDHSRDGALLQELFTRDGSGTLVSDDDYDLFRPALKRDIGAIRKLVRPLEQDGILAPRDRASFQRDLSHFVVEDREGMIVSCAAIYLHPEANCLELSSLAVHPDYRGTGRGDRMLRHAIQQAKREKLDRVVVLTTQTAHWFMERGFREREMGREEVECLRYTPARRSRILVLDLEPGALQAD